jgi:hypothetical protein
MLRRACRERGEIWMTSRRLQLLLRRFKRVRSHSIAVYRCILSCDCEDALLKLVALSHVSIS